MMAPLTFVSKHIVPVVRTGVALMLVCVIVLPTSAHAARLFNTGAELNSTTAGVEISTIEGATTVSTTHVRSGTYAWHIAATSDGIRQLLSSGDNSKGGYLRFYIYLVSLPGATFRLAAYNNAVNQVTTQVQMNTAGNLLLLNQAGTVLGTSATALATGQWYMIEFKNDATGGTGVLELKINGVSEVSGSNSTQGSWQRIRMGQLNGASANDFYIDDVAFNDDTGSVQNSYPGEGKLILLTPNGAGDSNQWSNTANGAGSTNNYTLVDDIPPNDATDYVQSNTLNDSDLYQMSDSTIASYDTVNLVSIWTRLTNNIADTTTEVKSQVEKQSGGTIALQGTGFNPTTTTWFTNGRSTTFQDVFVNYTDPDGAAWTSSTINSMQAGVKLNKIGTNRILVSGVYAYVDYTPGVAGPGTPARNMRLFEGFKIKLISGKLKLLQQ